MPNKIVDAINILYKDTIAQVITSYRKTDLFEIIAGVLLVDTIAPYLFIVALDYALREATRDTSTGFMLEKDRGVENLQCTDADSSENFTLISNYMEQTQLLLTRMKMAAETIVLHANCKKTEYMLFNQEETDLKTLSDDLLKQVHDLKHLGSWIADRKKEWKLKSS